MTEDLATALAGRVRGRIIAPGDASYDAARETFNGMLDRRPRLIVRPVDTADIAAAVRWAGEVDLPVGVRGGGHSVAGHSMPDEALVIDLSGWRGVRVDPGRRTADALGGSLLMDLDAATSAHGCAVPSGTFFDTGVAGLTLSGGIGYLVASEGFACDALVGAELVTADGSVVEVDETREPDLLWALRGGGGNFGVVTRLRYRLTTVERMYGGLLRYRGDGVGDAIERMFELDRTAPDELVLQAVAWHSAETGAPALTAIVAWRGDAGSEAAAVRPLREHAALYESDLRPMSWLQMQALNTPMPFGLRHYWKGHFVRETTSELAAAIVGATASARSDDFVLLELLHGAPHRIPADSAAFGGRRAVANVTALAIWSDAAEDADRMAWARAAAASFEPFSLSGGGYLNYPEVDQSSARVAAAFGPPAFDRLRRIKGRHDPANRFRFNGNIPPA
jgi:FAD/FMN-containing dehydrogenase